MNLGMVHRWTELNDLNTAGTSYCAGPVGYCYYNEAGSNPTTCWLMLKFGMELLGLKQLILIQLDMQLEELVQVILLGINGWKSSKYS
jgi:hypothetical protein